MVFVRIVRREVIKVMRKKYFLRAVAHCKEGCSIVSWV